MVLNRRFDELLDYTFSQLELLTRRQRVREAEVSLRDFWSAHYAIVAAMGSKDKVSEHLARLKEIIEGPREINPAEIKKMIAAAGIQIKAE